MNKQNENKILALGALHNLNLIAESYKPKEFTISLYNNLSYFVDEVENNLDYYSTIGYDINKVKFELDKGMVLCQYMCDVLF